MVTNHGLRGLKLRGVPSGAKRPMREPGTTSIAKREPGGDGVNHTAGVSLVVAEQLHQTALGVPASTAAGHP